jgi:hypothetical protein
MENVNERLINDIKKIINFYEKLGETNPKIEQYLEQLYLELNNLENPKIEDETIN